MKLFGNGDGGNFRSLQSIDDHPLVAEAIENRKFKETQCQARADELRAAENALEALKFDRRWDIASHDDIEGEFAAAKRAVEEARERTQRAEDARERAFANEKTIRERVSKEIDDATRATYDDAVRALHDALIIAQEKHDIITQVFVDRERLFGSNSTPSFSVGILARQNGGRDSGVKYWAANARAHGVPLPGEE